LLSTPCHHGAVTFRYWWVAPPERDFHPPVHALFQAHEHGQLCPHVPTKMSAWPPCALALSMGFEDAVGVDPPHTAALQVHVGERRASALNSGFLLPRHRHDRKRRGPSSGALLRRMDASQSVIRQEAAHPQRLHFEGRDRRRVNLQFKALSLSFPFPGNPRRHPHRCGTPS
jgi:hypothetical protein